MARFGTAALAALALIVAPVPAAARQRVPAVQVWLTTPDGAHLLEDAGTVPLGPAVETGAPTVVIDPKRRFQTMTGFGASITDSSAAVLYRLDPARRAGVMADLFAVDRLNVLRQPIGASDFTDEPAYTYDDLPAGQTDYALRRFSVAHDGSQILPLLRQAARLNPELRIAEYYTLGHLARFVRPGATRVASTSFGTTGWNGQVMDVAFVNPNGDTVLVAHNENDNPQAVAVRLGDRQFGYTLPGGALATFVWRGRGDDRPINPTGWTATASPASATDIPANAVDDDASTRFSTGAAQHPGQYLQVDLGRVQPVKKIVFDTGASTGDYPRDYTITGSVDGSTWWPIPTRGSGQFSTGLVHNRQIRFVRIAVGGDADNWWSVADVRAYS